MKKFFQDFKKFISRGNIIDMAVGVIIGGAFSAIVTALTNKIIMPLINALLALGGTNGLEAARTIIGNPVYKVMGDATSGIDWTATNYIDWGAFITAIIDFFLIALVLFLVLKVVMKSSEMFKLATGSVMKGRLTKAEKAEMKALALNYKDKEVIKNFREEKAKQAEEAKAAEEAKKKAAEEEAYKNSTEYLLKEILATLQAKEEKPVKTAKKAK